MVAKLRSRDNKGLIYEAVFVPEKGMNLIHFTKGSREVIDQNTKSLFEARFAGLGAIIGPHFHHRNPQIIPKIPDASRFPHIANLSPGTKDPFSHGIGRYAEWTILEQSEARLKAFLKGQTMLNGYLLKDLEGQDFTMTYTADLGADGLKIVLSVESETGSVVGLHTYYGLVDHKGIVEASVQKNYRLVSEILPAPENWNWIDENTVRFTIDDLFEIDAGFFPYPDVLTGDILLKTESHHLRVRYHSNNQENSWQLWHPKGASFVCIEPLSAKDPRKPHLTTSQIQILISILG